MKIRSIAFYISFLVCTAVSAQVEVADSGVVFKIDVDSSTVAWTGRKIAGQHNGLISIRDGELLMKNGILTGGNVSIDMNSLTDLDMKNQGKETLEHHLKSDDFFDVAVYPVSTLSVTSVSPTGRDLYTVYADLTIKGVTQPIHFDVAISRSSDRLIATSVIIIDRTLFNIRYGSGKFFKNLGDKIIYDEFELDVRLVAFIP